MTKREFILQGFTKRTHADALRELFDVPDIRWAVLSVAFVSESGVREIEERLKTFAANVTIFAGIRNEITSHQALTRLYSIIGSQLFTVDTGTRNLIFHPKFYLVCGEFHARLMIGSANLTLGGLNNNVEASIVLDFDLTNQDDKAVVNDIQVLLLNLPLDYPSHVMSVHSTGQVDDLLLSGRVTDETAFPAPRQTAADVEAGSTDTIPRIKLKVQPLSRTLTKARAKVKTSKSGKASRTEISDVGPAFAAVGAEFDLVWESKPLTRRDLTIPDVEGTHATGSMNLDKGLLSEEIDHRHYFREDVFNDLLWLPAKRTTEEAYAKFHLVLKGLSYGEFDLRIGHTVGTTSKTYRQRNAMTRLSWGPASEYVARPDLIGRTLALYRDRVDPARFVVEID